MRFREPTEVRPDKLSRGQGGRTYSFLTFLAAADGALRYSFELSSRGDRSIASGWSPNRSSR